MENKLKLAVPTGHLLDRTAKLLKRAGFEIEKYTKKSRSYRPVCQSDFLELKVYNPREIPMIVAGGMCDMGITGLDWVHESGAIRNTEDLTDLMYGEVKIVLAVPDKWDHVNSLVDLIQLPLAEIRIWTEYLNLADEFIFQQTRVEPSAITPWMDLTRSRRSHSKISLILSFGATEGKPPEDGEAIIDASSTGDTLRRNGLKVIAEVMPRSTAMLFASQPAMNRDSANDHDPNIGGSVAWLTRRLELAVPTRDKAKVTVGVGHIVG